MGKRRRDQRHNWSKKGITELSDTDFYVRQHSDFRTRIFSPQLNIPLYYSVFFCEFCETPPKTTLPGDRRLSSNPLILIKINC